MTATVFVILFITVAVLLKYPKKLKTKRRNVIMYHSLIKIPLIGEYDIISLKTKKRINHVIERENMREYVLLNGLYLFVIHGKTEESGWLKHYLKTNYGMTFEVKDGVEICKFLLQNGSLIPLKFRGSLSEFFKSKEHSKANQEKAKV